MNDSKYFTVKFGFEPMLTPNTAFNIGINHRQYSGDHLFLTAIGFKIYL